MPKQNGESKHDESASELLKVVIKFEPTVEFSQRESSLGTVYVARDGRTGKFYRFGVREYHAVMMLDGVRSLGLVHEQLRRDGVLWSEADVVAFVRELLQHRLAFLVSKTCETTPSIPGSGSAGPNREAFSGPEGGTTARYGLFRNGGVSVLRILGGILCQRLPLADGDRVAQKLLPGFGFLFGAPAMVLWTVLVFTGVGVVWGNAAAFSAELRRVFDQQLWLVLLLMWCVLKVVHESGHAVCAKRHGVRVGPMGIVFFLFAPLAYVDVTDAWKLVRRRDRIQIALAGVYVELAIGASAALVWWLCPIGFAKHCAAQVFLVAGPATILVNANPLLRLDGYYVVSDLLEIPNLRSQGRRRLRELIEWFLFRIPLSRCPLSGWRREFAVVHAICSVLFQVVWMSGLMFAVSSWAKGLGLMLAVIAIALWGVVPLIRWIHKIWTLESSKGWLLSRHQERLIAIGLFVLLMLQYAAVATSPLACRVPVVIQFQNEQIARAPVEAFVSSVFVKCGDRVRRGMLLMELEQPELHLKRDQLRDQRDIERSKAVQHRQRGEIALAEVANRNAEGLDRQLNELNEQIASMRIVADRDGKITTPATNRMLGTYVRQGSELLRVSDPQEKEVLAIVAEGEVQAYKNASSSNLVAQIRLRGGVTLTAPLGRLEPAASRALPHPALAATAGGPLAVQILGHSDSAELVCPQLRSVIPLDALTSMSVESGQIGRMTIPDDRTIVSRLFDRLRTR